MKPTPSGVPDTDAFEGGGMGGFMINGYLSETGFTAARYGGGGIGACGGGADRRTGRQDHQQRGRRFEVGGLFFEV